MVLLPRRDPKQRNEAEHRPPAAGNLRPVLEGTLVSSVGLDLPLIVSFQELPSGLWKAAGDSLLLCKAKTSGPDVDLWIHQSWEGKVD